MGDLSFSWWWCWRLQSSRMWSCTDYFYASVIGHPWTWT